MPEQLRACQATKRHAGSKTVNSHEAGASAYAGLAKIPGAKRPNVFDFADDLEQKRVFCLQIASDAICWVCNRGVNEEPGLILSLGESRMRTFVSPLAFDKQICVLLRSGNIF